jgi:hypothetical protein
MTEPEYVLSISFLRLFLTIHFVRLLEMNHNKFPLKLYIRENKYHLNKQPSKKLNNKLINDCIVP